MKFIFIIGITSLIIHWLFMKFKIKKLDEEIRLLDYESKVLRNIIKSWINEGE